MKSFRPERDRDPASKASNWPEPAHGSVGSYGLPALVDRFGEKERARAELPFIG
jgi:hypothetical protein